jgi:DNA-directed RNA polymerase specialized sigma24 family protein
MYLDWPKEIDDERRRAWAALRTLPAIQQRVILLAHETLAGCDESEKIKHISVALGLPQSCVRDQLRSARLSLRRQLTIN